MIRSGYKKKYKTAYRKYKNAQDRYRRKGLKKLSEERQKQALEEMKVDENGAVVTDDIEEEFSIVMIEEHILADNGASITTTRTMDDSRITRIQQLATMNATNLVGLHDCQLCKEDDTVKEKRKPIYGHKAHLMHLLQGLIAPDWAGNTSNKSGQHTEAAKYIRANASKNEGSKSVCTVCGSSFKGKNHVESSRRHLNNHANQAVTDCTVEEAKEVIVKHFWENFQVEWDPSELDCMLQERKPQEKKR
ncbi:hypothetical protein G6F42_017016 [Rhizopus arrhizus]|nr:hypothetical protein G6F42_017016 [Rhizopus arrhizus]